MCTPPNLHEYHRAIEILKRIYNFPGEDGCKVKHWFRCKSLNYATNPTFEKNLYPESGEPMHGLGISVKCPLIEVILGMNSFRESIPWKNCAKCFIGLDREKKSSMQ